MAKHFLRFYLKRLQSNALVSGSLVLFIGSMGANLGNYLYHLLMGRMLGPEDYGTLTALLSLAYILSIPSISLSTAIVKFVTRFKARGEEGKVYYLFIHLTRVFVLIGLIVTCLFFLLRVPISRFLHLDNSNAVLAIGIWLAFTIVSLVNDGLLKAYLQFKFISFISILTIAIKVVVAVFLVSLGFSYFGGISAIILAAAIGYLIAFWPLRFLRTFREKTLKVKWGEFFLYSLPVGVANLGLTSLYSADILLVKHFFPAGEAGLYSSLAVLGKIVFFASGVIPVVMFPLVSTCHENRGKYRLIFWQAFALVAAVSSAITFFYYLFPRLMLNMLYGSNYLAAAPSLGWFAVFIAFYSLDSLLINFFLSIGKTRVATFPLLAAVLQIVFITLFHQSVFQVISVSVFVSALLLVSLLLFYLNHERG